MEAQSQFGLPPTPPSSLPSDDSEGNLSPDHHGAPMSPQTTPVSQTSTRRSAIAAAATTAAANSSKIYSGVSTRQPIHTPLISNQPESRRKKKEYMDQLERRVEILVSENSDYRKRIETLEGSNANLLNQLAKLQAQINRQNQKK
uniref:Uncharacterized protein n=1 Tax=Phlebotomus papatasi TaxID=29031 RepID=A0A1B0DP31_PHLPP